MLASAVQEVQHGPMGRAKGFLAAISAAFAPLVDLVYPPRCPLCGVATAHQSGLCADCWGGLVIPGQPACTTCSRPFPPHAAIEQGQCAACLAAPPIHAGIAAATLYNDASRRLVLALKHGGRIALAPQLAQLMAARIGQDFGDGPAAAPLLVPVPLHRWRLWRRGYNQAALLARELARLGKGELLVEGLLRCKATPMLGGMRRKARQQALRGAIRVHPRYRARIRGRAVLLVDDVLTSGATSEACISALLGAGASSVMICCFARVLDEGAGEPLAVRDAPEPDGAIPILAAPAQNITPEAARAPGAT